ncbi:GrpB family protein [Nocardia transvalensis]|uniref:GrpB family protein n=1 Tax=Nocardia transvalensis TaxID=37333 RepID=UPI0018955E31|nr:GrpB family protein [Nocardia transvalensis]MBF6327412.1 GrpB family protein [Nocardia transvalensis]
MSIIVVPYDPDWPRHAQAAITELTTALPGLFLDIEHMGSTSVPGLAAKPVIDLMASVSDLDEVVAREDNLAWLGYRREENGMSGRLFYPRDDATGQRTHHLHIVPAAEWDDQNERILRDHLLANPAAAAEYAALKQRLATETSDPLEYTRRKTDLIQRLVDVARAERGLPLVPVWVD